MNTFQPEDTDAAGYVVHEVAPSENDSATDEKEERKGSKERSDVAEVNNLEKGDGVHVQNDATDEKLYKDFVLSVWLTIALFCLCVF